MENPITLAIQQVGLQPLAKALSVTYPAMKKWEAAERLPRSEFTGETNYASIIESLTDGAISKTQLIEWSRKGWGA